MARTFQSLLFMLAGCSDDRLIRQNEMLKAENEMLRKRVPKKNIHLKPQERERLLKLGLAVGPSVRHLLTIVSYSTFRRWVRNEQGGKAQVHRCHRTKRRTAAVDSAFHPQSIPMTGLLGSSPGRDGP